jgi:hypothetical protein
MKEVMAITSFSFETIYGFVFLTGNLEMIIDIHLFLNLLELFRCKLRGLLLPHVRCTQLLFKLTKFRTAFQYLSPTNGGRGKSHLLINFNILTIDCPFRKGKKNR